MEPPVCAIYSVPPAKVTGMERTESLAFGSAQHTALLARLGGDEFAILLGDSGAAKSAELLAARLKVAMSRPLSIIGGTVTVTLSIGIAYCNGKLSARDLTHLADRALYAAKESGRNTFHALRTEAGG